MVEVELSDDDAVLASVHLKASPEGLVAGAVEGRVWPGVDDAESLAELLDFEGAQVMRSTASERKLMLRIVSSTFEAHFMCQ